MSKKQQFADEFRKEAVRQVIEKGLKVTDVAPRFGAVLQVYLPLNAEEIHG